MLKAFINSREGWKKLKQQFLPAHTRTTPHTLRTMKICGRKDPHRTTTITEAPHPSPPVWTAVFKRWENILRKWPHHLLCACAFPQAPLLAPDKSPTPDIPGNRLASPIIAAEFKTSPLFLQKEIGDRNANFRKTTVSLQQARKLSRKTEGQSSVV